MRRGGEAMQTGTVKRIPNIMWGIIGVVLAIGLYGLLQQPWSTPFITHTPDEKHVHQVFGDITLSQNIMMSVATLDGVSLYIDETTIPEPEQPITLFIREPQTHENIRIVSMALQDIIRQQDPARIYIPFKPITGVKGQTLEIAIKAEGASKAHALRIRYQSDGEKYPSGKSYTATEQKQGNIGFVLYERPTIGKRVLRWIFDKDHRVALAGLLLACVSVFFYVKFRNQTSKAPNLVGSLRVLSVRRLVTISALIIAFVFVVYAPALQLFYFFDDVPILARAEHFSQTNPWNFFTMRSYDGQDPDSQFSLPHWRPLSANIYPLLTTKIFGLHAAGAYATNLVLIALTGTCIAALAYVLLKDWWASSLVTAVWIVHSTRIGVVYWWSSSQDIIASLFFMLCLLVFLYWRARQSRWILYISAALYFLGLLSKENVFLLPIIAIALDWLVVPRISLTERIKALRPMISMYGIIAGIFLILRTVAFWDPGVSQELLHDPTYALTTNPVAISKNIVAFSAWTAEHQLWPQISSIDHYLQPWMDPIRITKPIYPGILLMLIYFGLLAYKWRSSKTRNILLFAGLWWVIMLGPLLLITQIWFSRWLYMPVFALGLLLAYGWQHLPSQVKKSSAITALLILAVYGFWSARLPEPSRKHREQSAYTQEAIRQAVQQKGKLASDSRIYAVGVTENQRTSITNFLFYLAYSREVPLIRVNEIPHDIGPHDIVIDMSSYDAYYPENDL